MKSFEIAFESYPQLIMGLFIWQGLQIQETSNQLSIIISAAPAIYGFALFGRYYTTKRTRQKLLQI